MWAVDARRSPDYWFPRQCPRVMTIGGTSRVHAIEYGWLERMRTVELYAYRFDIRQFQPFEKHAHVATEPVAPLGPAERVGGLFALHEEAGIELRVLSNLWPFWDEVTASGLEFSGIRLHNALPRSME